MGVCRRGKNLIKHGLSGIAFGISQSKIPFLSVFAVLVSVLGVYYGISLIEWALIVLSVSIVFTLELVNTCIELLCDLYDKDFNPRIKEIKDISAGAVLLFSLSTVLIGIIIFVPRIFV